jgi:hypothetical protein
VGLGYGSQKRGLGAKTQLWVGKHMHTAPGSILSTKSVNSQIQPLSIDIWDFHHVYSCMFSFLLLIFFQMTSFSNLNALKSQPCVIPLNETHETLKNKAK